MNLTAEKLIALWKIKDQLFKNERNKNVIERFDVLVGLFDYILNCKIEVNDETKQVFVDGIEVFIDKDQNPNLTYFGPAKDAMPAQGAMKGVENMVNRFNVEFKDTIIRIACLLGGFDFATKIMQPEYRILSNTVNKGHDNGELISEGLPRHPSSHLADNNYFFWIIKTIQDIKYCCFNMNESHLVLRYYEQYDFGKDEEQGQRSVLNKRFPYKFFYMWANKDIVIHPLSLMTYRNLIRQNELTFKYEPDKNLDLDYSAFSDLNSGKGWKDYSKRIIDIIKKEEESKPEDVRCKTVTHELSKLISIIMVQEQDTKSIMELIETGNKAVILWGSPGTGKTYEAKRIVTELLKAETDDKGRILGKYLFENGSHDRSDFGYYTIVQFHPNYTYEDFMGGIRPNIDAGSISYSLISGIFKRFCDEARKEGNEMKKYIMIIDEINRADLSSVFGELLYALEYRTEMVQIPHFNEKFCVPKNVYIIGTMNNIDKSLVTLDLALRRRFGFYKILPNMEVLKDILCEPIIEEDNLNKFISRCKELNEKIVNKNSQLNLDEEHKIGHAYYGKIRDFLPKYEVKSSEDVSSEPIKISILELEKLWNYHIEPLLEEYLGGKIENIEMRNELIRLKEYFIKDL